MYLETQPSIYLITILKLAFPFLQLSCHPHSLYLL